MTEVMGETRNWTHMNWLPLARHSLSKINLALGPKRLATTALEHVENFCDLGVVMDSELKFDKHIYDKINIANKMLGIINRNFKDLDINAFISFIIKKPGMFEICFLSGTHIGKA